MTDASRRPHPPAGRSMGIEDLPRLRGEAAPRTGRSVSPDHVEPAEPVVPSPPASTPAPTSAAGGPTEAIRGLLDEAERVSERLRASLDAARSGVHEPERVAGRLQERLRVGARMLQAFQNQIERAEAAVGRAAEAGAVPGVEVIDDRIGSLRDEIAGEITRLRSDLEELRLEETRQDAAAADAVTDRVDGIERRLEAGLERTAEAMRAQIRAEVVKQRPVITADAAITARIEDLLRAAESRLEERTGRAVREMADERARVEQAAEAARELSRRLETGEVNADEIASRIERSVRDAERRVEDAREEARRAAEIKAQLAASVREVDDRAQRTTVAAERRLEAVGEAIDRSDVVERRLLELVDTIDDAARRIDGVGTTIARLESTLERLEPWKRLLCDAELTDDGLPRPAIDLVEHVRDGLGAEVVRIGTAMREMADRLGTIGDLRKRAADANAIAKAAASTTEPTPGAIPGANAARDAAGRIADDIGAAATRP